MVSMLRLIRDIITNPPIQFGDEPPEHWSRWERWQVFRPMWTHTLLTTHADCGCRRRFGLWRTIYCAPHVFGPVWDDGEES